MPRERSHYIETKSKDYFRSLLDNYDSNGNVLVREWTEKDYGVDFVVEFFDDGHPTGNIAYLQLKATENKIKRSSDGSYVSCKDVTAGCLEYARQKKVPYILVYISLAEPREFYFVDVQSLDVEKAYIKAKNNITGKTTIRIPSSNFSDGDLMGFMELINKYY